MQTVFRANLSAANFPLVSDFMGRSVIVPQYDENYLKKKQFSGDDPDLDIGVPQIYYGHNIMPSGQGFKSIAYNRIVKPVIGLTVPTFDKMIPAKDPSENKALLGVTSDSRIFIFTSGSTVWTEITSAVAGWTGSTVFYAYANGYTYVCLSRFGVYKVDVLGKTLTPAVLTGIVTSAIVGLTSASNYLILHDDVTVYWSSATNVEDFVPSLTTGAGSGVPQDVNGKIIACLPLNNGFAIYTTTNIVTASYSGNLRFPWIFKGAANSAGILSAEQVSYDGDQGTNYAWTAAGLLKVAGGGCTPVNPEVTDFLAGRIFEDFDTVTRTLTTEYLSDPLIVKVAYVASRYLVLSYGKTKLTHAIVFDTSFKRWGKLKLDHADCFEVAVDAEKTTTWTALAGFSWTTFAGATWSEFKTLNNVAASAKRTLGFLQTDGSVKLAIWDYGNYSSDAVLILGKYQITRNQLCTMQGYEVENSIESDTAFETYIMSSIDGKNVDTVTTPYMAESSGLLKTYNALVVGLNHSIVFHGAFNLVSVVLRMTRHGRR